ncbi:MAG: acyl-CoA ligase (AMP-forming), exosortase A system-associated [Pseudomonadota bacterium]
MTLLLHELPQRSARRTPDAVALVDRDRQLTYADLADRIERVGSAYVTHGLGAGERVAIALPKTAEAVVAMFAAAAAGGVFVPVNALLKPVQMTHILSDSRARILVTNRARFDALRPHLGELPGLHTVFLVDDVPDDAPEGVELYAFELAVKATPRERHRRIDADVLSIFYTSGSTGKPKGVTLSHANMVIGAESVAQYLENTAEDRLLAALPFSFDYGFSQLSTAFLVGARVVLLEYLLPRDVLRKLGSERITGLAGVPPLFGQLAGLKWPEGCVDHLRYFTNSGGAMPKATLAALRERAPAAKPYLMYGLTEAFRSTFLPPDEVDTRPESMGKAIPNADVMVLNENGERCAPGEIGELVHRGALVSLGYWNNPEKTAERFKTLPLEDGRVMQEVAVFSGDNVRMDEDGFLYFVGRRDEMIKTSGYRVSPNEIEEVIYDAGVVEEAVAFGAAHKDLGQGIVVVAAKPVNNESPEDAIVAACREALANFMVPRKVVMLDSLPRNPNGKIDRKTLSDRYADAFAAGSSAS